MSKTAKTAIGGMLVALSVVLLIPTALEIFVYALPAFAGVITLFCVIEMGKSWALGVYAATAIIGMLVVYCLRNTVVVEAPHGIPELIAVVVTAGLHVWKRNNLLSIGVGTVLYMFLIQVVF